MDNKLKWIIGLCEYGYSFWLCVCSDWYSNWAFSYGNILPVLKKWSSSLKARNQDMLANPWPPSTKYSCWKWLNWHYKESYRYSSLFGRLKTWHLHGCYCQPCVTEFAAQTLHIFYAIILAVFYYFKNGEINNLSVLCLTTKWS